MTSQTMNIVSAADKIEATKQKKLPDTMSKHSILLMCQPIHRYLPKMNGCFPDFRLMYSLITAVYINFGVVVGVVVTTMFLINFGKIIVKLFCVISYEIPSPHALALFVFIV